MPMEKLANLERMLGNSYNENLGIRLTKDSPYYEEIARIAGNSDGIKRMLNLN
jgi:hypothetical protein